MGQKVLFSWSGGKDSAIAFYEFKKRGDCEIASLITTVTENYKRISMHGIRQALVEKQAEHLDIPIEKVPISKNSSNEEYEHAMRVVLKKFLKVGVSSVVFGDIFLEDVRKYREGNLAKVGMKGIFPIWKKNTRELAREFVNLGFKAVITSVDTNVLDKSFAGRNLDKQFLSGLPSNVDPCGENGEFHSFVYDGPIFREKIPYSLGETVLRDNRFCYCDVLQK